MNLNNQNLGSDVIVSWRLTSNLTASHETILKLFYNRLIKVYDDDQAVFIKRRTQVILIWLKQKEDITKNTDDSFYF